MDAVILISVGIDSPVAAHLMTKKGVDLIGVHFFFGKLKRETLQTLMRITGIKKTYCMDMSDFHAQINKNERYRCILCKRFMYKAAFRLAKNIGAEAIVTGENLGQVASQTLQNMHVIEASVSMPILRPILCFDKTETMAIARDIGTYDISIRDNADCPVLPGSPATSSTVILIEKKEEGTDYLVAEAVSSAVTITG